jgi:hypothetical protein
MPPASRRFLRRVPTPLAAAALLALAPLLADAPLAAQRTDRAPVPPRTAAPPRAATPAAATDSARWGRTGLVTDSTGAPIVAATVLEVRTGVVQSTDSAGRFRVRGARIGTVSLEIRAAGYEPMVFDYEQLPGDTATLTVPLVALDEPPPLPFARLAGSLAGRVLDPSGRPLVGATIQVLTALKEVRTDTLGRFALAGLPPGRQLVRARQVGYLAESFFATITDSTSTRLVVQLTPMGQDLGTVAVRARAGTRRLEQFEARRRRLQGFASFIDAAEIRARDPVNITDVLRGMRGVTVTTNPNGRQVLVGRGQCLMAVRIDGMEVPVTEEGLDAFVIPNDVAAIEVYPGDGAIPLELRSGRTSCGVVAIWTK